MHRCCSVVVQIAGMIVIQTKMRNLLADPIRSKKQSMITSDLIAGCSQTLFCVSEYELDRAGERLSPLHAAFTADFHARPCA